MARILEGITGLFAAIPHAAVALLGRLSLGWIFWTAARGRMGGSWNLLDARGSTLAMLRGAWDLPYVSAEAAAVAFQVAEHVFPVLLVLGLATRFAALGMLLLTAIFLLFVNPAAYAIYGAWAALLLMLMKFGPGSISLDHLLGRR